MVAIFCLAFAPASMLIVTAGFLFGGAVLWASIAYVVGSATLLDFVWRPAARRIEAPRFDPLVLTALLAVACAAAFVSFSARATIVEIVIAIVMFGLVFGSAVSAVAHELVHQDDRPLRFGMGMLLSALSLDPADTVGHEMHHQLVGTAADPSSARRGEGFWRFALRSAPGAATGAFAIERARLEQSGLPAWSLRNRVVQSLLVQTAVLAAAWLIGSWQGLLALLAAGLISRIVGESSKYSSHYGLVRVAGTPVAVRHSWNSRGGIVAQAMFNAGWHSDHHVNGERPYHEIVLPDDAPINPFPAGLTFAMTLVPSVWFAAMDPLVARWANEHATPEERALLDNASRLAGAGAPEFATR
jgi:hypothetical protein